MHTEVISNTSKPNYFNDKLYLKIVLKDEVEAFLFQNCTS